MSDPQPASTATTVQVSDPASAPEAQPALAAESTTVMQAPAPAPGPAALGLDASKSATLYLTKIQILVAFLVLITPIVYFNGRVFHDGWYSHFHLDPAMFPLDTAGTLTWGAIAWGNGLIAIVTTMKQVELGRWLLPMSLIGGGAVLGSLVAWGGDIWKRSRAERGKLPTSKFWQKVRLLASRIFLPILMMGISAAAIYVFIFVLMFVLAIMSAPFFALGETAAKKAALNDFSDMPMATVKTQTSSVQLREMGCGPQFCALWGNKHASVAPVSAITWGEAPAPSD